MMNPKIEYVWQLRLSEIDLRQELSDGLEQLLRSGEWRESGAKSFRDFCMELGLGPEGTREILIDVGEILPTDKLVSQDPECQARLEALLNWRNSKRVEMKIPAYRILSNRTLLEIAETNPKSEAELSLVAGIGAKKLESFGNEILSILHGH